MGFGLCCVSMPALSKMLSHHLPAYEKVRSWISSHYSSVRPIFAISISKKQSKLGRFLRLSNTETTRSHDSYLNLEDNKDSAIRSGTMYTPHELGHMNSVRTVIGTGRTTTIKDGSIHYKVDLQQNNQRQIPK